MLKFFTLTVQDSSSRRVTEQTTVINTPRVVEGLQHSSTVVVVERTPKGLHSESRSRDFERQISL